VANQCSKTNLFKILVSFKPHSRHRNIPWTNTNAKRRPESQLRLHQLGAGFPILQPLAHPILMENIELPMDGMFKTSASTRAGELLDITG
jgi:hypothetical protein